MYDQRELGLVERTSLLQGGELKFKFSLKELLTFSV